jgi:DMSO/TMAO reductase YedYZ molybdopterin-dependent catalytic subunit
MTRQTWTRRQMLQRGSAAFGGLLLGGCDRLSQSPSFHRILSSAEQLTYRAQRLIVGQSLAREFTTADLSPVFRSNGTARPRSALYNQLLADNFSDWRLMVGGLVNRPLALSLADLRALPARTQITRHDCVEGWSAIGQWTGVPLGSVLAQAQLAPEARFIVLFSADELEPGDGGYYESIDLMDAFHPQTLLAYELNGRSLPVANGAPLRLRVERQLGYKQAKYLMRIDAVARLDGIGAGKGGYWEGRGYEWYAGI